MNLLLMAVSAVLQVIAAQSDAGDTLGGLACLGTCFIPCIIVFAVVGVIPVMGMWKAFTKAGQPGFAAIIPFYNVYVMCEIAKKPDWFILCLIPCVGIYFYVMLLIELAKAFGKDTGFAIGLLLLAPVFWSILGFGSAQYQGNRRGRRRRRDADEDEEEEDRPRRRRARDEDDDEEEDRPKRRRPRDDDDD